ncbi:MAG: 50S ribosomal protein L23 [Candidatus Omnitrophota bacterium]|nr:MAG: 50S ribosomal protein L23 [Candidatus Omnitrophota bacterium]
MLTPFRIVRYVLSTEKSTLFEKQNKYFFCVDKTANKVEIKKAIEYIYNVKVNTVNTQMMPGKPKRVRYKKGKTSEWKKAVITLRQGQKIVLT